MNVPVAQQWICCVSVPRDIFFADIVFFYDLLALKMFYLVEILRILSRAINILTLALLKVI